MIGRTEEARDAFREALRIEPGFLASFEHLVRSYLREGDAEGARAALKPYMDTEDSHASVLARSLEGDTYVAEGRYRDALAAYRAAAERAAELSRDDLRLLPLIQTGDLATFTGAHDEALAAFHQADVIDALNGDVLFGLLINAGERGRVDEMLEVRDSVVVRFAAAPPIARQRTELFLLMVDGLIAWYQGDAGAAVELFDQAREEAAAPRPAMLAATGLEALALIEAGRAREALDLAKTMYRASMGGNRLDPGQWQAALYLQGRAYEALDEPSHAAESYEMLLRQAGDGLRDMSYLGDTPDRLAALRRDLEGAASG
jgi:tetratricopeptide (TPR) repeat protein